MYINLRCGNCRKVFPVAYNTLYGIWKTSYVKVPDAKKPDVSLSVETPCECGHTERFDTPMFKHTFGVMFEEMRALLGDN